MDNKKDIVPSDQILPQKVFIIPLDHKPVFPGMLQPILIRDKEDMEAVEIALKGDGFIGLLLIKNNKANEKDEYVLSQEDFYKVGTLTKIIKKINLPDGGINVFINTIKRFKVKKFLTFKPYLTCAITYKDDINADTIEVKALTRALISEMKEVSEDNPLFTEEIKLNMINIDSPGKIADFITSILNVNRKDQQDILECFDIQKRMENVLVHLKKEKELIGIQKKIQKQIDEKITKQQRQFYLREELKEIKKELGMDVDDKSRDYRIFKEKIDSFELSGEVKEKVEEELEKFRLMDPHSSEYFVTRNYLETIVTLPWNSSTKENLNLKQCIKILNKDHYGMEDVKDRIIEFIAVRNLKKGAKGSMVCLVGPPGVGKTSIGKSVAKALNRPFFRFSLGGMRDEAEIKGHRRTYVGAMPGKILQALKIVKHNNPVIMLDEIDKLGQSYQGDPSSALLEVLDPEQNIAFRDHYLDLPFDISNVLFMTTANTLDTIPSPLLNRMEVIRLSGYIEEEKLEIAKRYLIPKSIKKHGLEKNKIRYRKTALMKIAREYAREAGLRNFEKNLDKVHRKIARIVVENEKKDEVIEILKDNLDQYLGKPIFTEETTNKIKKPGIAIGLAWTALGGATLNIETIAIKTKGSLKLTGKLGSVMQESATIALSYVKGVTQKIKPDNKFFETNEIHLHVPAGATPKDGPSAGITMASSLLSLFLKKKIKNKLAMTGELSLIGNVLPVGGLKEKVIAAKRNRITEVIHPAHNQKDIDEIPDYIKAGIKFHPVNTMEQVIDLIFANPENKK